MDTGRNLDDLPPEARPGFGPRVVRESGAMRAWVLRASCIAVQVAAFACGAGCSGAATGHARTATVVVTVPAATAMTEPDEVLEEGRSEAPFVAGAVWTGYYTCSQGRTELVLRIVEVHGSEVSAVFDFTHRPTEVHGSYQLSGRYDAENRSLDLHPDEWIARPPNYVMVGMTGTVSSDGRRWDGKITHPSCTTFQLQKQRQW